MTRVDEPKRRIEYVILADVVLLVRPGPGGDAVVRSDRRVDHVAVDETRRALAAPIGSSEHAAAVNDLVTAQRTVRNTSAGYWIAGADPDVVQHALTGELPFQPGSEAALLTDGASAAIETYDRLHFDEALDLLAARGPEALIESARSAELADPAGLRWPRYKTSDDATALYLRWPV